MLDKESDLTLGKTKKYFKLYFNYSNFLRFWWLDKSMKSIIICFILIMYEQKEIVHSLQNLSSESYNIFS
jgi:hypothetical protein